MQKSFKRTLSLMLAVVMAGAVFSVASISASAVEGEPEIAGTSITLNGAIGLNFYVKENGNTDYDPEFSYSDSLVYTDSAPTTNLDDDAVYDSTNTYRIYTIDLYAKQMTEEVTFSVSETEKITTSVREYAEKIISGESDAALTEQGYSANKIAKAKELCTAMLNYGAQAQTEFNYKTGDLANKNYSDYTAPALDPASMTDMDYSNPAGEWIASVSRVYQFVNTYDWEHVYVHYMFEDETIIGDDENWSDEYVFADDIVEEIFPSEYTYTDPYDDSDISNGKTIYLFEPTQDFSMLSFTSTPDSLNGETIYTNSQYASYYLSQYDTYPGWKNWVNGEDNSYESLYSNPVQFIDLVNAQNWESVSVDIITEEWDSEESEYFSVSHTYPMTKLSEKAANGSDVYRLALPEDYADKDSVSIRFTSGSEATLTTRYYTSNNIHRYTPSQRTDRFAKFGVTYSGSSIGLLQKIGYTLFFCRNVSDNYVSFSVYSGETVDYERWLDGAIDPQYAELGYSGYSIRDIAPSDLLKPIKVTFQWYDEEYHEQTETVEFTVYNYIKRALKLDDSNNNNIQLKKTVTALVDYAQKAEAYFNA